MDSNTEISREELERMVEQAQKQLQDTLDKMTPEEREQAELKAKKLIEEDNAAMQKLIEDAKNAAVGVISEKTPKYCKNCGAKVDGGKFCAYCGNLL